MAQTPASSAQQSDAANARQVIAAQPTIAQSINALLMAVTKTIEEAMESGDPGAVQALADSMSSDPKSWSDAVMANTPDAVLTASPLVGLPSYVSEKWRRGSGGGGAPHQGGSSQYGAHDPAASQQGQQGQQGGTQRH